MTDQGLTTQAFEPPAPSSRGVDRLADPGVDSDAVIREALTVIDDALRQLMSRELMSSGEVADVLLDVRTLLSAHTGE
jgi:hypothetical protein